MSGKSLIRRKRASAARVRPGLGAVLSTISLAFTSLLCAGGLFAVLGASPRPSRKAAPAVAYDIVYVRMPREGVSDVRFPDFSLPLFYTPGSPLVRLRPDGTETIFVDPGPDGAAFDPVMSFDGQWVYYALAPWVRTQGRFHPPPGSDIYKKHVVTGEVIQLTHSEWTPPSGAANWSSNPYSADPPGTSYPGYGIINSGPCPVPGGKVVFVSNRETYLTPKGGTNAPMQLYIMDEDGGNVEKIGHLNIGGALHPHVLKDGRVVFSSYESQGIRGTGNTWGLWAISPDGRNWEPLFSSFQFGAGLHFQGQRSDGTILSALYYIFNNWGFGTVLAFNPQAPPDAPGFGSAFPFDPSNPAVRRGIWFFGPGHEYHLQPRYTQYQFSPPGLFNLSGFGHEDDNAASYETDETWAGKATHPAGAPGNAVMLVWSPGPVNALDRPVAGAPDAGIYLITNPAGVTTSRDLVLVKNDPNYNEIQPRPMVPYSAIYGIPEPATIPYLPNDGTVHPTLPAGTPFGLIGTSSFYKRDTTPASRSFHTFYESSDALGNTVYLDPFNTGINTESSNWVFQGADAGKYSNSDIWAVRIVAQEPAADLGQYLPRPGSFSAHHGAERLRIIGEIPLRKGAGVNDPDGNPDTSFLAKIPADTPFTFQTLDRDGMVLNMAQTWHQLRPGEMRADCGGCHAHSQRPTNFAQTAASRADYVIPNLVDRTQLVSKDAMGNPTVREVSRRLEDVEYFRDIKPILTRSCATSGCHTGPTPAARLNLDDSDGTDVYSRLASDTNAEHGIPPLPVGFQGALVWRYPNASRYVRMYQARRSLLMWKVMGRRLDGWTNADHPTETVPGDPATYPEGVSMNYADIDYTGTIMPPPGTAQPLTEDEKMTFARWIDLGCPVNWSGGNPGPGDFGGWYSDELKPTLTVSRPRSGPLTGPLTQLRIGAYDSYSGLNRSSLSVVANFTVNGNLPGTELGPLFTETSAGSHIWAINLSSPITGLDNGRLFVRVRDNQGNYAEVDRSFGNRTVVALFGDLNQDGSVTTPDSVVLANYLVGNLQQGTPPFTAPLAMADVNRDGNVNAIDAVTVANFQVGNIPSLPWPP